MNKEKRREYIKQYYIDNKEKIGERSKKYRENNREIYNERHKIQSKEYRENNREKVLKSKKDYYYNNLEKVREQYKNSVENRKEAQLKKNYNITLKEYYEMLDKQNNCCAICGKNQKDLKKILNVDHNHITGKVRGLLCFGCNSGIGKFNDDVDMLLKAVNYIKDNN